MEECMTNGLLTGLARGWFIIYSDAKYGMQFCLSQRIKKRGTKAGFGILIDDDFDALCYQIHHYRARRAKYALLGPGIKWHAFHEGNFDDEETATRKGTQIEKNFLREDWVRYMYAKRKLIEDYPETFNEEW